MPLSRKAKESLDEFYNYSTNDYEDNDYGDDFEDSADNSDREGPIDRKENRTKPIAKKPESVERDYTQESYGFKKRKEQSFASNTGFNGRDISYSQPPTARNKISARGYGNHKKARTVTGSNRGKDSQRLMQDPYFKPRNDGVKRVLSANRNKVNALQNLILELQNEVEQLRQENRDLKRTSRIQEKAIKKFDNEEAEIPFLIQKHNSEVRVLREKLKKQKGTMERSQEEVHRKDLEIQRLRDKLKKSEEIIKDKRLDERDVLQQKILKLEESLAEKDSRISELERVVTLGEKARTRELKEKNDKYKKALEELKRLESMQRDLQGRFKEKEKELEVQNIYSQRIPWKKKFNKSQPLSSSRAENDSVSTKMRKSSSPSANFEKSFESGKYGNVVEANGDRDISISKEDGEAHVETMMSALRKQEEELERVLEEGRNNRKMEEEKIKLLEMDKRIRRKEEEIRRVEKVRQDEMKEFEERHKEEKRLKEERLKEYEKQKEEEERLRLREISNRKERDLDIIKGLEKEASSVQKDAFLLSNEAEESLRNRLEEQLDRKRVLMADSEDLEEEKHRQKKDQLLARLQAIDSGRGTLTETNKDEDQINYKTAGKRNGNKTSNEVKGKPIFLESSKVDDANENLVKHPPLDFRFQDKKRRGSKEYSFKREDENLHRGLPSQSGIREDSSKQKDDILFGEYSPSIGSAGKERTSRFGKDNGRNNIENELLFSNSTPKSTVKNQGKIEGYPFFDTKRVQDPVKPSFEETDTKEHHIKGYSNNEKELSSMKGSDAERRNSNRTSQSSANKSVFGAYEPTFGKENSATSEILSPELDPFAEDGPKYGRRRGKVKKLTLEEETFSQSKEGKRSADVRNMLKETEKLPGNVGTAAFKAVSSFTDDDIEEMVLI